jgi:hypothetical protein
MYNGHAIHISNRTAEDIIAELQKYINMHGINRVIIGNRVCFNECDMYGGECTCDTYSVKIDENYIHWRNR